MKLVNFMTFQVFHDLYKPFTDKIHYTSTHFHRYNHEVVRKSPALKESYFVLQEVVVQWRYSRLQQTDKQHRTGRLHILEAAT